MTPLGRRFLVLGIVAALIGTGVWGMPRLVERMGHVRYREMGGEVARIRAALAEGRVPYPARSGLQTTQAYLELLIRAGVLAPGDRLFFKNWLVANLDPSDPPGTVFLATKSWYAYTALGKKDARGFAFVWLDGAELRSYEPPAPGRAPLPPRRPELLPFD
ncbi:MAG: hypothetical protein PW734_05560 [Verrucomicrobium sp.]|nr:hypothetical protein [Verrucomicrobium sp.]